MEATHQSIGVPEYPPALRGKLSFLLQRPRLSELGHVWTGLVMFGFLGSFCECPLFADQAPSKGRSFTRSVVPAPFRFSGLPTRKDNPPPKCSLSLPGSLLGNPCPNRAHPSCLSNAASLFLHSFMLWGASVGRTEGHRGAHDEGS